jgi:hypothetical protein
MATKFPFGAAATEAVTGTGGSVEVEDHLTIITLSSLTGAATLNCTAGDTLTVGAMVIVKVVQGATGRNVTMGTLFDSSVADLTGVANDTDIITCFYDGTSLVGITDWVKIVDAA